MTDAPKDPRYIDLYALPTHVRTAIKALIAFADRQDSIGYDAEYFRQDLPGVVARALNSQSIIFRTLTPAQLAELTHQKIPEYILLELKRIMSVNPQESS